MIEHSLQDPSALLRHATESVKAGAHCDAKSQLLRLLEFDPQHELATGMLAAVCVELNEFDDAVRHYGRVLELNPTNSLARMQLGRLLLERQQPLNALQALRSEQDDQALQQTFGDQVCAMYYYCAVALTQLERPAEALASVKLAQQRMPLRHELYRPTIELLVHLETVVSRLDADGQPPN